MIADIAVIGILEAAMLLRAGKWREPACAASALQQEHEFANHDQRYLAALRKAHKEKKSLESRVIGKSQNQSASRL